MQDQENEFKGLDSLTEQLMSNIQGGLIICQYDPQQGASKVLYMSEGWTKLTGYDTADLNAHFGGSPQAVVLDEDAEAAAESYREQIAKGNFYELQYRFRHKDGSIRWAIDRGVVNLLADGQNQNQSILTDITPMKESEEALRLSEARFRIATRASRAAVYEFDLRENRYLHIENAEELFGRSGELVIAEIEALRAQIENIPLPTVLRHWYHDEDVPQLLRAMQEMRRNGSSECELRLRQGDGDYLWCKLYLALVGTQNMSSPFRAIGYMVNYDAQHKQTERLLQAAQTDPLTGLLNKNSIRTKIEQQLSILPAQACGLLVLDVDDFKRVNDSLGHLFGDAVLMETASKLCRLFRHDSLVGRIGGDEFLVLVLGDLTPAQIAQRAGELCRLFRHTYTGDTADYSVSCSIGVALATAGDDFEALFAKADAALYQAKAGGKDRFILYTPETVTGLPGTRAAERLRQAERLDSGQLQLKERIFELLYSSLDFSGSVNMILALLGERLGADRVYVFEVEKSSGAFSLIYEWCTEGCAAGLAQFTSERLHELSYFDLFDEQDTFYAQDTQTILHPARVLFLENGVRSTFQVAMRDEGRLCGFIGYDSNVKLDTLAAEHADLMRFTAKLTATFILKKRAEEQARTQANQKVEALDRLPCPIYVIDEDYRLHYLNEISMRIQPETKLGETCHAQFMQSETPCENCPGKSCQAAPCSRRIDNPHNGLSMIASASTVTWDGKPNCRLICCQISDPRENN